MPQTYINDGTDTAVNVSAFSNQVWSLIVTSTATAPRYLLFFDSTSPPSVSDDPGVFIPIPAAVALTPSIVELGADYFTANGLTFLNGVSWGWSTTPDSYQPGTASEQRIQIEWG